MPGDEDSRHAPVVAPVVAPVGIPDAGRARASPFNIRGDPAVRREDLYAFDDNAARSVANNANRNNAAGINRDYYGAGENAGGSDAAQGTGGFDLFNQ